MEDKISKRELHLICNAHIDPVWLWNVEEGISAALSTFRMAAVFCEEYNGLIFNHNEVVLYQWIEEMDPRLFARIQKLVQQGKWKIMGGWYLQPDCNMPCGESFLRQMESGRQYFQEKFGSVPTTAINFDPFGHSRGLVQLMAKAGYDSYLFCRPSQKDCELPSDDFIWKGFDGSTVMAHRADSYNSLMGEAGRKVEDLLSKRGEMQEADVPGCVLWGVGNHGGGPSRIDLEDLGKLMEEREDWNICHSTAEDYFAARKKYCELTGRKEPVVERDLNPWAVGCYTSQIRIKQRHRQLEGELSMTEKMMSQAAVKELLTYPPDALEDARKALMFSQFHDILPGSSIQSVEEQGLRTLDYGLEIVSKWKQRAFFALMEGCGRAAEGEYPVLIYNPHPYRVEGIFQCEFQLANQNWSETIFAYPEIYDKDRQLPSQLEKETCNLNLDWRKKIVFKAQLEPSCMNRFDVRIRYEEKKADECPGVLEDSWSFANDRMQVKINPETGLLDSYCVDGTEYLKPGACGLAVMETDCDSWGMMRHSYRQERGRFSLMPEEEGSIYSGTLNERYCGVGKMIPSLRIIEDGPVRRVIEAVFEYGHSQACVQYSLPREGTGIGVDVRVNWSEKGSFLKLELPTALTGAEAFSETAYGVTRQEADGNEKVFHRWCGYADEDKNQALTVINNGNYGVDFLDGCIRLSLIHSAGYSAHPIEERPLAVQDRFLPYIDQGERNFSFFIQAGEKKERMEHVLDEAIRFQEAPMVVQAFPTGGEESVKEEIKQSLVMLDSQTVVLTAMRREAQEDGYLVRLFQPMEESGKARVRIPVLGIEETFTLSSFEVKTLHLDIQNRTLQECGIFGL